MYMNVFFNKIKQSENNKHSTCMFGYMGTEN